MSEPPKNRTSTERIIASRLRLRERFQERIAQTPGHKDDRPQGSGPANRHGMPQLPVGQHETQGWPVLDLGVKPQVSKEDWELVVDGACHNPLKLGWEELMALPQVEDTSDFHCVTSWSKFDMRWKGISLIDIAALAQVDPEARYLMAHGYDGYTTNVELVEALKKDVLLVHTYEDEPLPIEHGGHLRMITPQLYAWKGAKWICKITFMKENQRGFWEERGYSDSAHPWRNDRYN